MFCYNPLDYARLPTVVILIPMCAAIDLLRLQGLPLICASTCCKAVFRSSFGPCRRSQDLDDRRHVLKSVGSKLILVGLVQMKNEKPLCIRWMRVWAATPVNAKCLIWPYLHWSSLTKPHTAWQEFVPCYPLSFHVLRQIIQLLNAF